MAAILAGCGDGRNQPAFPDLQPVKGVVKKGNATATGGVVRFTPDPDTSDFIINSVVGPDGTFTLSTVRSTDTRGERKVGAPAGSYKVTYTPPLAEQGPGGLPQTPIDLPKPVSVQTGENNLTVELPARK